MFDDASHTFTVVNSTARVAIVVKVPVAHSRLVSAANSFAMLLFVSLYIVDTVWLVFEYVCVFLLGFCNSLLQLSIVYFSWGWLLVDRRPCIATVGMAGVHMMCTN